MTLSRRSRSYAGSETWPGFVDALSAILLVIIFLVVVFVLAQFFLHDALSGRDEALAQLNEQVSELSEILALERQTNDALRLNMSQLEASLKDATSYQEEILTHLAEETDRANKAETALARERATTQTSRETILTQLTTIESLSRDIDALDEVRNNLEVEIARLLVAQKEIETDAKALIKQNSTLENERNQLATALASADKDRATLSERIKDNDALTASLRDRTKELLARLSTEKINRQLAEKETFLAQRQLEQRELHIAELQKIQMTRAAMLEKEKDVSSTAQRQVALLNQQISALRTQLAQISQALDDAEAKDRNQNIVIADLGRRLNLALAQKLEELSRYRSEFFGRLRTALGNRPDIQIVGDRFVFQSEVLFQSGSADLGEDGRDSLAHLATNLLEISRRIPNDLPWILRVDGHTDRIPIKTPEFPSNWELASARATAVVKFLAKKGIPPQRLAATGFAEYQPIELGSNETAYMRNRRIEIKLTER